MSAEAPAHVLRDVLDGLGEVVFRTDAEGNWTYLNAAWTRILGFDVASSLGTNFLEYVHPDERERTIALFMAVVAGGADHCHHDSRYRTAAVVTASWSCARRSSATTRAGSSPTWAP